MGESRKERQSRLRTHGRGVREAGSQADLFGAEGQLIERGGGGDEGRGPGRPAGAQNKTKRKLAQLMAARGYRDPAEQLALLAGLDRPDLHPLAHAALIAEALGEDVTRVASEMRQAAAAVMPYYHGKVTPDVAVTAAQMVVQLAPQGASSAERVAAPPPLPIVPTDAQRAEFEEKQGVSKSPEGGDE
jgi:hypothetical protein